MRVMLAGKYCAVYFEVMDKLQRIHEDLEVSKKSLSQLPPCFRKTRLGYLHDAINQYRGPFEVHVREYPDRYVFHVDVADPRFKVLDHALYDIPSKSKIKKHSILASVYAALYQHHLQRKTKERMQRTKILSSRIGRALLKINAYAYHHAKSTVIVLGMLMTILLCLGAIYTGNTQTLGIFESIPFFVALAVLWMLLIIGIYKFKKPCEFYDTTYNECILYHLLKLEKVKAKKTRKTNKTHQFLTLYLSNREQK